MNVHSFEPEALMSDKNAPYCIVVAVDYSDLSDLAFERAAHAVECDDPICGAIRDEHDARWWFRCAGGAGGE